MSISAELATKIQKLPKTQQAIAWALAEGRTNRAASELAGCTPEWVSMLKTRPEHRDFQGILDELTMTIGLAVASERAQLAKQAIEQFKSPSGYLETGKDVLEWAKYLGTLTDGPEGTQKVKLEFDSPATMEDLMEGASED